MELTESEQCPRERLDDFHLSTVALGRILR